MITIDEDTLYFVSLIIQFFQVFYLVFLIFYFHSITLILLLILKSTHQV